MKRAIRYAMHGVMVLSLLLCAASAALWVQSYRQWYALAHNTVTETTTEWKKSSWTVMLEPSCIHLKHEGEQSLPKTEFMSGPELQMFILTRDPPSRGFQWNAGTSDVRWNSGISPNDIYWSIGRFTRAGGDSPRYSPRFRITVIPLYGVMALTGVLPAVWLRARLRARHAARRAAAGMCPACGYDLRASTGRCPECGRIPTGEGGMGRKIALDDHKPRGKGPAAWREWVVALSCLGLTVVVLAGAGLLLLWRFVPESPVRGGGTGVLP